MNHKRRRPKNRRAGCLMCKPWKINGSGSTCRHRPSEAARLEGAAQQLAAVERRRSLGTVAG